MELQPTQSIPIDRQQAIIVNELEMWRNTRYQLQLRYRVNIGIGSPPETLKQLEAELVRCEKAIDLLKAELDALTEQLADARQGMLIAPNGKESL